MLFWQAETAMGVKSWTGRRGKPAGFPSPQGEKNYADTIGSFMNRQLNFGDTIFILNARIRMIRDLLVLDADPDFFLDKTLSDVDFIDAALEALLRELAENTRLIGRSGHFRNLHETERQFLGILHDLANGSGTVSVASYPELQEKVDLIRKHSLERQKTAEQHLKVEQFPSSEPAVSPDELNELLRDI
jgi:hypothetical protein